MGSDNGLVLIRVVEAARVREIGDVEGRDVVAFGDGEVGELAVVGDVRVDGDVALGLFAQVEEELGDTLVAIGVLAEGVDDPDLAEADGATESSVNERNANIWGITYVARAADSGFPGINLTSWMPPPSGMVMVEMMERLDSFHRRRVLAL